MGLSHSPSIVTDGLIFCLDFANIRSYPKSGTTCNNLVGINNGTLTNMDFANNFSDSNAGHLTFDGSNEFISVPNFMGFTNTFSICHWIRLATNQNTRTIFSNYNGNGWVTGISDVAQNVVKFYLGGGAHLYASSPLDINTWYLVSVTYDNGNPKIYINDELNNSSVNTINFGSSFTQGNDIGRLGVGAQYFIGSISSVMAYNRALTADEIRINYLSTSSRYT
jgi:hypothetical protein